MPSFLKSTSLPALLAIACTLAAAQTVASAGAPAAKNKPRIAASNLAMPNALRADQVWVTSVPIGLDVYYGASWKEKARKGRTPILIDKQVGKDTVFVYSHDFPGSEIESTWGPRGQQVSLKHVPYTGVAASMENEYGAGGSQKTRLCLTYELSEKNDGTPRVIVALFQPSNKTLKELNTFFPKGNNFLFDDAQARTSLAEQEVQGTDAATILSLLHRGGRVAVARTDKPTFYIEIGLNGAISVTTP